MKASIIIRSLAAIVALVTPVLFSGSAHAIERTPAEIRLQKSDAGWTFVDTRGMSVYTYERDKDHPGKSTCNGPVAPAAIPGDPLSEGKKPSGPGCQDFWPAVTVGADAKPFDDWTIIEREDGKRQWAYKGDPLYTYVKDTHPGAATGDGAQLVWRVAFQPMTTPLEVKISRTILGRTLTDVRGMTLYTRDGESAKKAICKDACLDAWVPVKAPWIARASGDWSVVTRADTSRQWAFRGKPLYASASDIRTGDINGHGNEKVWRAAVVEPAPPVPSWITVQNSDMGRVLADAKGFTIYAFIGDLEKVKRSTCNDECVKANLRSLVPANDAKPVGNFSIITHKDGSRQWAYKGDPLYTFTLDLYPGQILGDKFASGHGSRPVSGGWWRPIVESCMCSPVSVSS